nr:hypothetical protein GCM10020241_45090 [Streptoalloteichus tenebrarius]
MVLSRLLRAGEGKMLKRLRAIAAHINDLEDDVVELSDSELRAKTDEFRRRHEDGESLDDLLPEAFAVAREGRQAHAGPAPLRRPVDGWRGPALRSDPRDADR